jgi:hypothetical protein
MGKHTGKSPFIPRTLDDWLPVPLSILALGQLAISWVVATPSGDSVLAPSFEKVVANLSTAVVVTALLTRMKSYSKPGWRPRVPLFIYGLIAVISAGFFVAHCILLDSLREEFGVSPLIWLVPLAAAAAGAVDWWLTLLVQRKAGHRLGSPNPFRRQKPRHRATVHRQHPSPFAPRPRLSFLRH